MMMFRTSTTLLYYTLSLLVTTSLLVVDVVHGSGIQHDVDSNMMKAQQRPPASNNNNKKEEGGAVDFNDALDNFTRVMENAFASKQHHQQLRHRLQQTVQPFTPTRQCGEIFSSATKDEILEFIEVWFDLLFASPLAGDATGDGGGEDSATAQLAKQTLTSFIKYGFKVMKICMSCREAKELLSTQQRMTDGFNSYCSEDTYGYDAIHSALVMIPTTNDDDNDGTAFLEGSLRGFANGRATVYLYEDAPTETWPTGTLGEFMTNNALIDDDGNIDGFQDEVYLLLYDYLLPAIAASAGTISYTPDFLGYGESSNLYNRTYLHPIWYQQSYVLSFLATQQAVFKQTYGCTQLVDITTSYGYSEGGQASFWGSLGLSKIGIRIIENFSGGAPLQPAVAIGDFFGKKMYFLLYTTAHMHTRCVFVVCISLSWKSISFVIARLIFFPFSFVRLRFSLVSNHQTT